MKPKYATEFLIVAVVCAGGAVHEWLRPPAALAASQTQALEALGKRLFADVNLSRSRNQACGTCHNPDFAFVDPRVSKAGRAVSLGDDGHSLGDRNTPTLMYANLTPPLTRGADGALAGGLFWNGRADTLEEQAKGPLLNPVEMNMPNAAAVAERINENADYKRSFEALFGKEMLSDPNRTLDGVAKALAAYERTSEFAPFDSKYDRVMRGEDKLTQDEEFGRNIFLTYNCHVCHKPMKKGAEGVELFTSFEYHNIGLPKNESVRSLNGSNAGYVDAGLSDGARISEPAQAGKFKVPTLRNVAVTGPYMHNGVFKKLRTAIVFYNKYTSRRGGTKNNPETGLAWGEPEVEANIAHVQLKLELALDDRRVAALEAFLRTLTDKRYEHLLD